jgi:hypothetical protein
MNITVTSRIRFLRALRSRPFALLWGGQTISRLGDGAYFGATLFVGQVRIFVAGGALSVVLHSIAFFIRDIRELD